MRIPDNLVVTVKNLINQKFPEIGYRSHSEFIIDATRRRVEELLKLSNKIKEE